MKSPFDLGKMDLNKAVSVCLFSTILPFLSANAGSTTSPAEQASQLADIYDQGFNHSEIALLASHLTDDIGQRLTNSPAERLAQHWAEEKFRGWGLQNVHSEGLAFGRGWVMRSVSVRMVEPRVQQLYGMTIAWTPSTPGPVTAPIIVAPIHREEDLDPWRGKLKGAFVLVDDIGAGFRANRTRVSPLHGCRVAEIGRDSRSPIMRRRICLTG
jgi:carboxypeptidase Q